METRRERRTIAIDLGVSHSVVAYWDGIRPQVIRNRFNEPTTPSVVWFDQRRSRMVVGKVARDKLGHPQEQVVAAVKRKMGSDELIYLGDQAYLPHEVSGIILVALKEEAEAFLKEPVTQAVITVPAYFQAPAVEATKRAGEWAGLQVLALPEEPVAAALAYYHQYRETGDRNWLVFDSGGVTTDISVVTLRDGDFEVRGTAGDNYLAGTDFDRRLADLILRKAGVLLDEKREEHKLARIRLIREAEFAKTTLSAETVAYVIIDHLCDDANGNPIMIDLEVTRREFEDLIRQDVEDSVDYCRKALKKAEMSPDEIDDIILVGKTSEIPLIAQVLEEQLGSKARKEIDRLTCVAQGAAVVAGRYAVTLQSRREAEEFLEAVEREIRYAEPLAILREGQRPAAAKAFEALLDKDPEDFRAAHHLAVLHHGWAMELEEEVGPARASTHWRKGLSHWHQVWQADGFWEALAAKGASLGRDFKVRTVQQLRDDLPSQLLRLHAAYVTYWLEAGETERAKRHMDLIFKSRFPSEVRQAVRDEITCPLLEEAKRLREQGRLAESTQELETLLSVDPQHAKARKEAGETYNMYGVKLHAQRELDEAKRCFQRALHFDPEHKAARNNLTQLEFGPLLAMLGLQG